MHAEIRIHAGPDGIIFATVLVGRYLLNVIWGDDGDSPAVVRERAVAWTRRRTCLAISEPANDNSNARAA